MENLYNSQPYSEKSLLGRGFARINADEEQVSDVRSQDKAAVKLLADKLLSKGNKMLTP